MTRVEALHTHSKYSVCPKRTEKRTLTITTFHTTYDVLKVGLVIILFSVLFFFAYKRISVYTSRIFLYGKVHTMHLILH